MITNHKYFLNLAFEIAKTNLGKTGLNPSVGSIIVKNNTVISSGVTSIDGRPHAEFNALNQNKDFKGSNLYTTLEPCTHYGLTPPCVNLIVKKKIKNVYYAFEDPDVRTFKKAKNFLQRHKIFVKLIKNKRYKNFYDSYFFNKRFNQLFISSKIAISKDYYTIDKKKKWITNRETKRITHLLRSNSDCIFSTSKSINADNSLLNCRINGLNNFKPDLFIIDLNLKLKKNLSINGLIKKRKTFILTRKINQKKLSFYKKKGFKFIFIKTLKSKNDFNIMLKQIYKLGYRHAFFETGITFLNAMLKYKLLNILYVFQNNNLLKKYGYNNSSCRYLKQITLKKKRQINLRDDSMYMIKF